MNVTITRLPFPQRLRATEINDVFSIGTVLTIRLQHIKIIHLGGQNLSKRFALTNTLCYKMCTIHVVDKYDGEKICRNINKQGPRVEAHINICWQNKMYQI